VYRYYKFVFPDNMGNDSYAMMIAEIELLYGGIDQTTPSSPVTALGYYSTYLPANVVDNSGNLGNRWQVNMPSPRWLQIDIGQNVLISNYRIRASDQPTFTPVAWELYASTDGDAWFLIDTRSGQTGWGSGEWRAYSTSLQIPVAGTVLDENGNPVSRTIRVYRRDTGALLAQSVSSPITGQYEILIGFIGEINVVQLDDAAGVLENDQILRTTTE